MPSVRRGEGALLSHGYTVDRSTLEPADSPFHRQRGQPRECSEEHRRLKPADAPFR